MYCRNCGKELDDQAVVCVGCGVPPKKGCNLCQKCGQETNQEAEVCTSCGVRLARAGGTTLSGSEENTWAMLSHLLMLVIGFLGPLLILLTKGKESALAEDQAKEALNFHISLMIYLIPTWLLCLVYIGIPVTVALAIFAPVVTIVGAVRANRGEYYRYPLAIRFLS